MEVVADHVPMSEWGRDHWSTFAYLETRAVDHKGYLDCRQMRGGFYGRPDDGTKYPTRLRGYGEDNSRKVDGHNDYDCVADMIAEGLVEPHDETTGAKGRVPMKVQWNRTHRGSNGRFRPENWRAKYETHRFRLTPKGSVIAGQLRAHKAAGGNFATFVPEVVA